MCYIAFSNHCSIFFLSSNKVTGNVKFQSVYIPQTEYFKQVFCFAIYT